MPPPNIPYAAAEDFNIPSQSWEEASSAKLTMQLIVKIRVSKAKVDRPSPSSGLDPHPNQNVRNKQTN